MPDGTLDLTYRPAVRGHFSPLVMLSGPSGTGKTFSALLLARGMAGPEGKVCVADTDRGRARLYADRFTFDHLDLQEPFRPKLFEDAAIAAQRQGASVLVIDNFAHEWSALLEWHEAEVDRMARGDWKRRDAMKMPAWGIVKPPHKHMLQTLYRLNMPVILCCAAENKVAMVEQIEDGRKKTVPVDRGLQPIGDKDAAFAMTLSLMFEDPARPGVARPVKALLEDLKPIIPLDRPLDEETGRRIAAWARGDKETPAPAEAGRGGEETSKASVQQPSDSDEQRIKDGAQKLADRFLNTENLQAHQALVTEAEVQKQIAFLRRNRKPIYDAILEPAIRASFKRGQDVALQEQQPQEQGNLV